jgi:hypothetical protein
MHSLLVKISLLHCAECHSDYALLTTDAEVSLFTAGFKISNFTVHEY